MSGPSHQDVVRSAARWLKAGLKLDYVVPEAKNAQGRYPDVVGMPRVLALPPSTPVQVWSVECKRARVDLVGDLKRGKLLTYEQDATRCVLYAWHDAFDVHPRIKGRPESAAEILADLAALGLPEHWGVRVLWGSGVGPRCPASNIREPAKLRDLRAGDVTVYAESLLYQACARLVGCRWPAVDEGER